MLVNYFVVLVILFFAALKANKYFSLFIFFLYIVLRGDYGNDYYSYLSIFNDIKPLKYSQLNQYSATYLVEIGWV